MVGNHRCSLLLCIGHLNEHRIPPNVHFEVDDVEAEWTYHQNFDYIHSRFMGNAIKDWPKLLRQSYAYVADCLSISRAYPWLITSIFLASRHNKPGGYVEFIDLDVNWVSPDGSLTEDHASLKFNREFLKASRLAGVEPCPGPLLEGLLKDAGFENVVAEKYIWPVGTWPADRHLVSYSITLLAHGPYKNQSCRARIVLDLPSLISITSTERSWRMELPPNHGRSRSLHLQAFHTGARIRQKAGGGHLLQYQERDEGSQDAFHVPSVRLLPSSYFPHSPHPNPTTSLYPLAPVLFLYTVFRNFNFGVPRTFERLFT